MPPAVANSNFLYRGVLWYCIYMTMIFPLTCVEQYFVENFFIETNVTLQLTTIDCFLSGWMSRVYYVYLMMQGYNNILQRTTPRDDICTTSLTKSTYFSLQTLSVKCSTCLHWRIFKEFMQILQAKECCVLSLYCTQDVFEVLPQMKNMWHCWFYTWQVAPEDQWEEWWRHRVTPVQHCSSPSTTRFHSRAQS